jgi:succinoglycan biosynthesis protein ExoW
MIDKERQLYEFKGDFFNTLLVETYVLTSTVVYRYVKYPALRFREEFFNGQDFLFWLDISKVCKRIVFSAFPGFHYGRGVNICLGSGWDSDRALVYLCNRMKINKFIIKNHLLTPEQRRIRRQKINRLRYEFTESFLHDLRKRKNLAWKILSKQLKLDFLTSVYFLPNMLKLARKKFGF